MQRRVFFKTIITSAIASAFIPRTFAHNGSDANQTTNALPIIKPQRLKAGDTIGLVAPSSNVLEDEEINFAIDILKSFGFNVKKGKNLYKRYGYLAGQDKERADDINAMFADDSVDGIFCLRGGYGSPRILPYINYELIKQKPKVFIGYSDITALLNAITAKTGLVTFHGPIARQNFSDYTLSNFKKIIFNPQSPTELATPPIFEAKEGQAEEENRISVISKGKATGQLIGGNLSLMVKLIGTEFEPDYTGKILFLEEIEEAPYRVDGMLTHLWLAGNLAKVAGIVFGKCTDCEASSGPSLSIEQVLRDHLASLGIPVIRGSMIGHIDDMATIPVGAIATLDTATKKLTLKQTAVK